MDKEVKSSIIPCLTFKDIFILPDYCECQISCGIVRMLVSHNELVSFVGLKP